MELRASMETPRKAREACLQINPLAGSPTLDLELVITELVTNAVRHAAVEDNIVVLKVTVYRDVIRLEVGDSGPRFDPPAPPEPGIPNVGGWGLYLVDELTEDWGVTDGETTKVWATLRRAAESAPAGSSARRNGPRARSAARTKLSREVLSDYVAAERYARKQREARLGAKRRDAARPRELDSQGSPIARRPANLTERIARLLGPRR